ncbi:hypothetical protein FLTE109939_13320 [Flavobacterium terrigena]
MAPFDQKLASVGEQIALTKKVYAVPGVNGVQVKGFVLTKVPGVPGAGTGEPNGNTNISHCVAVPASVQFN